MPTVEDHLRAATERLRASGSQTARLDAEVLLAHAVNSDRTVIVAHPEALVGDGPAGAFEAAVTRREAGEPVAYIRGFKEFYGLAFAADSRALIPRPETERLVELAEAEVMHRLTEAPRGGDTPSIRVIDVGTGSGAVAVALAVALRKRRVGDEVEILATDDSAEALQLARENAVGHSVGDRVEFLEADLLPAAAGRPWDLVLANLPYVRSEAVDGLPIAASFEPRAALDGGPDGLSIIGRLLDTLPAGLAATGTALLEIGADQGEAIVGLVAERLAGWTVRVEADLAGLPRVARIAWA